MTGVLSHRWVVRASAAVLLVTLLVSTAGLLRATGPDKTGAGTPCDGCSGRCYDYFSKYKKSEGGCLELVNGTWLPDLQCLGSKCANWCDGCVPNGQPGVQCDNPNCWFLGIDVDPGNICANECVGRLCYRNMIPFWPFLEEKHCGQRQIPNCRPEKKSSLSCTECGCVSP